MSTATATLERPVIDAQAALKAQWPEIRDVINATMVAPTPFDFGTAAFGFDDYQWGSTSRGTRRFFLVNRDVGIGWASPTAVTDDEPLMGEPVRRTELDEALSLVKEFERLADGWDEPTSLAPSSDVVEDALVVLQNWPMSDLVPEPAVGSDGRIALELYDKEGFTLGGIEVTGERNAIYSIVQRTQILCTGRIDTTSQASILKALSQFRQHLE